MKRNGIFFLVCLIVLCLTVSGCALFEIPGKIIEGTFGLIGGILKVIQKLPTPPPGVF